MSTESLNSLNRTDVLLGYARNKSGTDGSDALCGSMQRLNLEDQSRDAHFVV
jgi:hypothetical protein